MAEDGFLALLTQAAWLDVDYGIPIQAWMFDNFRIIAVLETEAEPWFVGARVATTVVILQQDGNQTHRQQNIIKFVQFRRRLAEIVGRVNSEQERQQAFEQLKDSLSEVATDTSTGAYRVRTISQADLENAGIEEGRYIGSKWGRYLRSTETLYNLQTQYHDRFVPLSHLASIQRGATTNCDSFFLVKDISGRVLNSTPSARDFREKYGVPRNQVALGQIRVIRRRDGVELPLEANYLHPIIRTARDYTWFTTSHIAAEDFAVVIPSDRERISRLAESYIEAGEREGWHLAPSFQNIEETGGQWYTLRDVGGSAPILFIKTMQYNPVVLLNDAELLTNQRLYNIYPNDGVDADALCAILNSTIFICERYAAVKALGREAAIDVEVFSARAFRTPDLTTFPQDIVENLRAAMHDLRERQCGTLLEEALIHAGHSEAMAYAHRHPVNQDVWPVELQDQTRQEIDRLVLIGIGVPDQDVISTRDRIYNELTEHIRKLRLLELEAQINRRGGGTGADPNARQLADEIWAQLIESQNIEPRNIPGDFLSADDETIPIYLPAGRYNVEPPNLFDTDTVFACRVGRTRLEFDSQEQLDYVIFLLETGVNGEVQLPIVPEVCQQVTNEMQIYLRNLTENLRRSAVEITGEGELQRRILREGIRRVTHH